MIGPSGGFGGMMMNGRTPQNGGIFGNMNRPRLDPNTNMYSQGPPMGLQNSIFGQQMMPYAQNMGSPTPMAPMQKGPVVSKNINPMMPQNQNSMVGNFPIGPSRPPDFSNVMRTMSMQNQTQRDQRPDMFRGMFNSNQDQTGGVYY